MNYKHLNRPKTLFFSVILYYNILFNSYALDRMDPTHLIPLFITYVFTNHNRTIGIYSLELKMGNSSLPMWYKTSRLGALIANIVIIYMIAFLNINELNNEASNRKKLEEFKANEVNPKDIHIAIFK